MSEVHAIQIPGHPCIPRSFFLFKFTANTHKNAWRGSLIILRTTNAYGNTHIDRYIFIHKPNISTPVKLKTTLTTKYFESYFANIITPNQYEKVTFLFPTTKIFVHCRMAEIYRKGTQGSVMAWRAASFLLRRLLLLY